MNVNVSLLLSSILILRPMQVVGRTTEFSFGIEHLRRMLKLLVADVNQAKGLNHSGTIWSLLSKSHVEGITKHCWQGEGAPDCIPRLTSPSSMSGSLLVLLINAGTFPNSTTLSTVFVIFIQIEGQTS